MSLISSQRTEPFVPPIASLDKDPVPGLTQYEQSVFIPNQSGNRWSIEVASDVKQLGLIHAASMIAALQYWQRSLPQDCDVNLVMATGNTQLMGISQISRLIKEWSALGAQDRELLERSGVDISQERAFDPSRIKIFHLDMLLPQERTAEYSYAFEVNKFAEHLGVPSEKRFLFYGDLSLPEYGPDPTYVCTLLNPNLNRMSNSEFRALEASINEEGIRVQDFQNGILSESHIQHKYLSDVVRYGECYEQLLALCGGPHVINFGTAVADDGKAHIAFTEPYHTQKAGEAQWLNIKSFLDLPSFSALAGNVKPDGGMYRAVTSSGAPKMGAYTLSTAAFRSNPHATVLLLINTSSKSPCAQAFCEKKANPDFPATALQDIGLPWLDGVGERPGQSKLIVDLNSFRDTLCMRLPPLFVSGMDGNDPRWQSFIIESVLLYNEQFPDSPITLESVDETALRRMVEALTEKSDSLLAILESNLQARSTSTTINDVGSALRSTISHSLCRWDDVWTRLGSTAGDKILHVSPHLDDVPLALGNGINSATRYGLDQVVLTATPGDSAVSDEYAFNVLDAIQDIDSELFNRLVESLTNPALAITLEKSLHQELVEELSKSTTKINSNHRDYNFWPTLSNNEKRLRGALLFLQLNCSKRWHGSFNSKEKVQALADTVRVYSSAKRAYSGPKEIRVMRDIKAAIRYVEDNTEFMSRGVPFEHLSPPIEPKWYSGGAVRETTLCNDDIQTIKTRILKERPRVIVLNGEGFMDHEAHCLTEMSVRLALRELIESGELDWDCSVLLYRGVWDRLKISGNSTQLVVGVSQDDLENLKWSFPLNYRSQAPAQVPNGAQPNTFFSDSVVANAKATKDSLESLLGLPGVPAHYMDLAGFLAFDVIDLSVNSHTSRASFLEKTRLQFEELERVRDAIESGCHSKVVAPSPFASVREHRDLLDTLLANQGLSVKDVFLESEIFGCGLSA